MNIFWHRRDLRLSDNAGLYKALSSEQSVLPIFIFDKDILDELPEDDQRVLFIHQEVATLKVQYQALGADLRVFYDTPEDAFTLLLQEYDLNGVYINRDYEPYALARDKKIGEFLSTKDVAFIGAKDHVVFEKHEVLKDDGEPYKVFTPYANKWKSLLQPSQLDAYPSIKETNNLVQLKSKLNLVTLEEMGFQNKQQVDFPSREIPIDVISEYHNTRDIPALKGTSRLSLHLRFGTISIRDLARNSVGNEKYLNELIWRDFYQMIIYHFPQTVNKSFKPIYDTIPWDNNQEHFNHWCEGKTGYPIVDAGMRELNETGFMHNRVRMIVASFLTKHLLIDWRWGEAYFAKKLLDYELASNVGGWQWAASSGVDAQPYFRVFNPYSQQEKFDKDLKYIKRWVPEFGTDAYPTPIVEHKQARQRAIDVYKKAVSAK